MLMLPPFFPTADQMITALPKEMMSKYEDRLKEDDLNMADIEGLVRYVTVSWTLVAFAGQALP